MSDPSSDKSGHSIRFGEDGDTHLKEPLFFVLTHRDDAREAMRILLHVAEGMLPGQENIFFNAKEIRLGGETMVAIGSRVPEVLNKQDLLLAFREQPNAPAIAEPQKPLMEAELPELQKNMLVMAMVNDVAENKIRRQVFQKVKDGMTLLNTSFRWKLKDAVTFNALGDIFIGPLPAKSIVNHLTSLLRESGLKAGKDFIVSNPKGADGRHVVLHHYALARNKEFFTRFLEFCERDARDQGKGMGPF